MPRIFDNIENRLLPALRRNLENAYRADFCVGYFNLRGWRQIGDLVERWRGDEESCCRVLVGMQRLPHEDLKTQRSLVQSDGGIDQQEAIRIRRRMAEEFREQLTLGAPTKEDEQGLLRLKSQLETGKLAVKLFARHPLHAKLYLLHTGEYNTPIVGLLGSSNLTLPGLSGQGELNVDVVEMDAANKLQSWFDDRWSDRFCIDISQELAEIIGTSWVRQDLSPYQIYVKIAYHLSQEARAGLSEFRIPRDFGNELFEFQKAAVQIAAHHLNTRGGVLIGDVVGLGKTLMATTLARIFQDDHGAETLIICPKNLVSMWEDYVQRYRLYAKVLPLSTVTRELSSLRRYRTVLIDESHNLRNPDSRRYRAIQEYIAENESRCILLSATPYNKTYSDLSTQLSLFVEKDNDLGIRPEKQIREIGETEFIRRHQCAARTLAAFEKSEYADDWRELMRLYMVRRTRSFIQDSYAETDPDTGRKYLTFGDGTRSYFPLRVPRTLKFPIEETAGDPYGKLYSQPVVDAINALNLPRYGLGNYLSEKPAQQPSSTERRQMEGLSRSGRRLMGFCRTNLFKRLESGGPAFIQSIERHVLRNYVYLHAIRNGLDIPIGTQDVDLLDTGSSDEDVEAQTSFSPDNEISDNGRGEAFAGITAEAIPEPVQANASPLRAGYSGDLYEQRAAAIYADYAGSYRSRFKWLRPSLFGCGLYEDLKSDTESLLQVLRVCGDWNPAEDRKLDALCDLLTEVHPSEKILVFTQFADTVNYLADQLKARGIERIEGVTGDSPNPTALAWRFSPNSNDKRNDVSPEQELRVLVATDVLSEGQNLQDCSIILNYDLPWAIIRLVQRAGRVDRIGQQSDTILCYSFVPADGVERLIRLRDRVRQRLRQNAEVVGTDEAFFEDDLDNQALMDIYTENSGILDGDADTEVDLASYAYQIWKDATEVQPSLKRIVPELPNLVYSTRARKLSDVGPDGVLLYMRTADGNDALAWVDSEGNPVTQSQFAILQAAACEPNTPAIPVHPEHHELVEKGVRHLVEEGQQVGGQLGRPSGARFRTYERLKYYSQEASGTLFDTSDLERSIDEIYRYPLRESARDTLNRQLRSGISDQRLAELVVALREDDRLCIVSDEEQEQEPYILCSMGVFSS